MRVPKTYLDIINRIQLHAPEDDTALAPQTFVDGLWDGPLADHAVTYPPVGFLPWVICSLGNGDDYGYYWPVGMEGESPIVCLMSHDYGALNPIASSIEALERFGNCRDLTAMLNRSPVPLSEDDDPCESQESGVAARLQQDEFSPFLLVANADIALAHNALDLAHAHYAQAIALLPEYTAAHYGMAVLCRRLRRPADALKSMIATIRCPLCFRGASFWADTYLPIEHVNRQDFHRKCLHWLQQARSDPTGLVADDPLFRARQRLTFASGVTANDDYLVYDEVIDAYMKNGRAVEAIQLAMRVGELMMGETTPFRERYGFTHARHRHRLRDLLRAASLNDRARLLD
jgi:hypothetical protein